MFGNFLKLNHLHPNELDSYLEKGWFRMGQNIFTCNFLKFNHTFYSSIWLRIKLHNNLSDNKLQKLVKLNKNFKIVIADANINGEKEDLFSRYKASKPFETSESLNSLLLNNQEFNVFNTKEISIYDQSKLIAVGYFDLGEKCAAGIVSVYDPDYQKYSLGKYLIYNKILYCQSLQLDYFYPGYFAPGYKIFDYKLDIGTEHLEYLDFITNTWKPIASFNPLQTPYNKVHDHLSYMELLLYSSKIYFQRYHYRFYNINSISEELFPTRNTFDYPEFIFVYHPNFKDFTPVIVFNPVSDEYMLIKCIGCYQMPPNEANKKEYGLFILDTHEILFKFKNAYEILEYIDSINEKIEGQLN